MRRIDADELKYTISSGMCTDSITFSILLGMQNGNTNLDETTDKIVREHIKEVNRLIDNAPTEDGPQGEWIKTGSLGNGNAQYECSNCHYGDEHAESQEVPYCWHCGAKMKGGRVRIIIYKR